MRLYVINMSDEQYGECDCFYLPVDIDDFNAKMGHRWLIVDYEAPFTIEEGDTIESINEQARLYYEFATSDFIPYIREIVSVLGISTREVMERLDEIYVTEFDSYEALGRNYFASKYEKRIPGLLFKGAGDYDYMGRYLCENFAYYRARDGRILNLNGLCSRKRKVG